MKFLIAAILTVGSPLLTVAIGMRINVQTTAGFFAALALIIIMTAAMGIGIIMGLAEMARIGDEEHQEREEGETK